MTLRNDAQIKIDPWSPAVGAKGELQAAWFEVSNIPADQRSVRTLAKIGGLVGKVLEIDEKSRFRLDFVRMKIACRDVLRVPASAEGVLGMYIIDFKFVREPSEEENVRKLKSGIVVGDDSQPPPKKAKPFQHGQPEQGGNSGGGLFNKGETGYKGGFTSKQLASANVYHNDQLMKDKINVEEEDGSFEKADAVEVATNIHMKRVNLHPKDKMDGMDISCKSAPPKIGWNKRKENSWNQLTSPVNMVIDDDENGGKVDILDTFEDYGSETDSFGDKLRQIVGLEDVGNISKESENDQKGSEKMQSLEKNVAASVTVIEENTEVVCQVVSVEPIEDIEKNHSQGQKKISTSPEIFMTDDNIVNSQNSEEVNIVAEQLACNKKADPHVNEKKKSSGNTEDLQAVRRSERLMKSVAVSTKEKVEEMAKKKNLEGQVYIGKWTGICWWKGSISCCARPIVYWRLRSDMWRTMDEQEDDYKNTQED